MSKDEESNVVASARQRLLNISHETGDDPWNIAAVFSIIILAARSSLKLRPKGADGAWFSKNKDWAAGGWILASR